MCQCAYQWQVVSRNEKGVPAWHLETDSGALGEHEHDVLHDRAIRVAEGQLLVRVLVAVDADSALACAAFLPLAE
jgi:hypothetical protein